MRKLFATLLLVGSVAAAPLLAMAADCCDGGTAPCCKQHAECCKD